MELSCPPASYEQPGLSQDPVQQSRFLWTLLPCVHLELSHHQQRLESPANSHPISEKIVFQEKRGWIEQGNRNPESLYSTLLQHSFWTREGSQR